MSKKIEYPDCIYCLPDQPEDIISGRFEGEDKKYSGDTDLGKFYNTIVFRLDAKNKIKDIDKFQAIFVDPNYYFYELTKGGVWFFYAFRNMEGKDEMFTKIYDTITSQYS